VRAVQANPEGLHSLFIPSVSNLFHFNNIFMSVFNILAARRHVRAASVVLNVTQSSAMLPVLKNAKSR
jgi:hypothetical protein